MARLMRAVLIAASALVLAAGAAQRPPAVGSFSATYDIAVGGISAGELSIEASLARDVYEATADFRTTGIAGFFIEESWSARTTGNVTEAGLVPVSYVANRRAPDRQTREVTYSNGDPVAIRAVPALATEPWSIEARDQSGVTDPVTAILSILAPGRKESACDREIEVYDGQHRFAFDIGGPAMREGRLSCEAVYIRRSGYAPGKMGEDARRAFSLVFVRRGDGLFQVARVETDTAFGLATLRLRE